MPTNTFTGTATKMVRLATRSFQRSHQIGDYFKVNDVVKDVGHIRLRLKLVNWQLSVRS